MLTLNGTEEEFVGFHKYSNDFDNGKESSFPTTGNLKSWLQFLFEKFGTQKYSITILNGAITGSCSTLEFLELNRDVIQLHFDIVIFLCYNDIQGNSTMDNSHFYINIKTNFMNF